MKNAPSGVVCGVLLWYLFAREAVAGGTRGTQNRTGVCFNLGYKETISGREEGSERHGVMPIADYERD